jgi:hypothetical protein
MAEDSTGGVGPVAPPTITPGVKSKRPTEGSGQFAVYDHDLGQYVSGVGDKKTATQSKKDLTHHNGAITDGHKLEVREV